MTTDSSIVSSGMPSLTELGDDELVDCVERLRRSNRIMEMENALFENFLGRVDPKLLLGIQAILDQASRIQGQLEQAYNVSVSMAPEGLRLSKSAGSVGSAHSWSKVSMSSMNDKRINLSTRIDMLVKDRELYLISVDDYYIQIKLKRDNIKAELEEINTRIAETRDAREIFEHSIVRDAVDPLTQRIPAEKFVRYMEEWLKSADSIIEKLRLRTCTLKYKKIFLQNQLKQKEELGESLHPVDLDQLKIDHRVLNKKLEQKNIDLLDLKKKSGEANLILSKNKRFLLSQTKALSHVKIKIEKKKKKLLALQREIKQVEKEVIVSAEKLTKLEDLNKNYTVPELIDYIQQKKEIYSLKQNIKIWERRNNIQQIALDTCIKTMKRLTQRNIIDPQWFEPAPTKHEDDSFHYDDEDI